MNESRVLWPAAETINVRNIRFDLSAAPRCWHGGGTGATAFFDALSACFPHGERFFIRAVKGALPEIDDPSLIAAVKGFSGQESMHTREHEAYNARLRAFGYDIDGMEREQARCIAWIENDLGPEAALGVTACLEHMTSILAGQVTRDEAYFAGADLQMRELWLWHAMEEAEHGDVAFDALKAMRSGYFFRIRMMLLSTRLFLKIVGRNLLSILEAERKRGTRGARRGLLAYLFVSPGLARRIAIPYLAFYRPGFHPSKTPARRFASRHRAHFDALAGE